MAAVSQPPGTRRSTGLNAHARRRAKKLTLRKGADPSARTVAEAEPLRRDRAKLAYLEQPLENFNSSIRHPGAAIDISWLWEEVGVGLIANSSYLSSTCLCGVRLVTLT